MRLLLDTHVVLWWLGDDTKLTPTVRSAITSGANEVFVSSISVVEISIKFSLGKLRAPRELLELLTENGLAQLPFSSVHAIELRELPWHHRDPFDRMLVAQARVEGLTLATADQTLRAYDVALAY